MEKRLIVLTGGIGAGKSVVARILRLRGFEVYDCDSRARIIMESASEVRESLVGWCGEEVYDASGALNRQMLGSRLFSDTELRSRVNSLVHRLVREDIAMHMARLESEEAGKPKPLFVETAIPVVSGLADKADEIWLVTAPEELRVARACGRDGHSADHVRSRIAAQRSEWDLLPAAKTRLILNDGLNPLLPQVNSLLS